MKHKHIFIYFIFVGYYLFNNLIPKILIQGTYENVNFEHTMFYDSNTLDTLILSENNEFYSSNLGYGNYKVSYGFCETKISLNIEKEVSYHRSVTRSWLGAPKIMMFHDMNHHYKKISWDCKIDLSKIERYKKWKKKRDKNDEEIRNSIRAHIRKRDSLNID